MSPVLNKYTYQKIISSGERNYEMPIHNMVTIRESQNGKVNKVKKLWDVNSKYCRYWEIPEWNGEQSKKKKKMPIQNVVDIEESQNRKMNKVTLCSVYLNSLNWL